MYKLICQKVAFFYLPKQLFIVLGMYNFGCVVRITRASYHHDNNVKLFALPCKKGNNKVVRSMLPNKRHLLLSDYIYTQPDCTVFLFKSIWTHPQACEGCQKNLKGTRIISLMCFFANIQPKLNKL